MWEIIEHRNTRYGAATLWRTHTAEDGYAAYAVTGDRPGFWVQPVCNPNSCVTSQRRAWDEWKRNGMETARNMAGASW